MREDAATKARRLLSEGRVYLRHVTTDHVNAWVRGDSAEVYRVTFEAGAWSCDCIARTRCSHVRAVQLTTVVNCAAVKP